MPQKCRPHEPVSSDNPLPAVCAVQLQAVLREIAALTETVQQDTLANAQIHVSLEKDVTQIQQLLTNISHTVCGSERQNGLASRVLLLEQRINAQSAKAESNRHRIWSLVLQLLPVVLAWFGAMLAWLWMHGAGK